MVRKNIIAGSHLTIHKSIQPTSLEHRSGNEDSVNVRHVISAGRPVLRYYCTVTKWSECIIYLAE